MNRYIHILLIIILTIKTTVLTYVLFNVVKISYVIIELIAYTLLFYIVKMLFKKFNHIVFLVFSFLVTTFLVATISYFKYYGSIPTYDTIMQLGQMIGVGDAIGSLFDWRLMFFYVDIILLLPITFFMKKNIQEVDIYSNTKIVLLAGLFSFCIFYNGKIINELEKLQTLGFSAFHVHVVAKDVSNMFVANDVSKEEVENIKARSNVEQTDLFGIARDKNILVVQLESMQDFVVDLKIESEEVTPNLNKFVKESLYFTNIYQQTGKGNTSDSEFMLNTSIYPLGKRVMSESVEGKRIPSLPKMLKPLGYESVTFHTNDVTFWNRNEMYPSLGFDRYYDKEFFGVEDMISYGSSDEVLYKKAIPELLKINNKGKQFYANLIAMSSHYPYNMPSSKWEHLVKLPERYNHTAVGTYLEAMSYADYAFGELIKNLKENNLYDETVILVYGDHQGLVKETEKDEMLMREILGRDYHHYIDHFNIPLLIKSPGLRVNVVKDNVGGQIDFMPTIAHLVGLSLENKIYFGQSLFSKDDNQIGIRFYAPTGTYINEKNMFIPGKSFKDGEFIDIKSHNKQSSDGQNDADYQKILRLMELSDRYFDSLE